MSQTDHETRPNSPAQQPKEIESSAVQVQAVDTEPFNVAPDSIWRRVLSVSQEDFFRDVERALTGAEPGTLEAWIRWNEAHYPIGGPCHWAAEANGSKRRRDQRRRAGRDPRPSTQELCTYRKMVFTDLELPWSDLPAKTRLKAEGDLGLGHMGDGLSDTTWEYDSEPPYTLPEQPESGKEARHSQIKRTQVKTESETGRGSGPSPSVALETKEAPVRDAEGQHKVTIELLQREYGLVMGMMERLYSEGQDPRSVPRYAQMQQEWRELEITLVAIRESLKWHSMFEAGTLHMYTLIALGLMPGGAPNLGQGVASLQGRGGNPATLPSGGFNRFGAHPGYQFGPSAKPSKQ